MGVRYRSKRRSEDTGGGGGGGICGLLPRTGVLLSLLDDILSRWTLFVRMSKTGLVLDFAREKPPV